MEAVIQLLMATSILNFAPFLITDPGGYDSIVRYCEKEATCRRTFLFEIVCDIRKKEALEG